MHCVSLSPPLRVQEEISAPPFPRVLELVHCKIEFDFFFFFFESTERKEKERVNLTWDFETVISS